MSGSVLETPEYLASDLCWLLSRASQALTTEVARALERLGLSPREYAVLATAMSGDHTQIEMARVVGLDKTTMVVTLDALEASGLAIRRPLTSDRRARVVVATPRGKRKVREAEAILAQVREEVLSDLDSAERDAFVGALGKLVAGRLA
jgi:DNA-binding MarR family transcriptional regulator